MTCAVSATLDVSDERYGRPARPVVLVDGRPDERLWVESMTMTGPLDRRVAQLRIDRQDNGLDADERDRWSRLIGRAVTVVQPVELAGGDSALMVLLDGVIDRLEQAIEGRSDGQGLRAICHWSRLLETAWNGSAADAAMTLGQWVDRLDEQAGLGLAVMPAEPQMLARRVGRSFGGRATVGRVLNGLCEALGLVVVHVMSWSGGRVRVRRELRSEAMGRAVRLSDEKTDRPTGWTTTQPARRPIRWIAQARGQVVESTFVLQGGWDPAGQGQPDSAYQRSANPQFEQVANVYRLWVLNEDGALGGEPFDLAGLFGDGRTIEPQALRFGAALTRSAEGRSLGRVLEVSTDAGATWANYAGRWSVLTDRAGVLLSDDALDGAYLTAAKAGLAQVRLTATLRNPLPIELVRWTGNPFVGPFEQRVVSFGDAVAWRQVASTSRFYAPVRSGAMSADEIDERAVMQAELIRRTRQAMGRAATDSDQAQVRVVGPQLGLRIGDRWTDRPGCQAGEVIGPDRAFGRLASIEHDWRIGASTLTWRL